MIVLKNVSKSFGRTKVLAGISLSVEPGEFVCITGPSGAGKSTLLSLLVGADSPTTGSISVDDVDLQAVPSGALQLFRRKVGMVFQDYKLLGNRTVAENIAFPLEVCGVPDEEIERRVSELLARMNLQSRRESLPDQLSGGEKARTAIARALSHKPLIVLADEPTGNLDREQATRVMELFKEIHAEGTTVIVATHDSTLVEHAGARVIRLEQGSLAQDNSQMVRYVKKPMPVAPAAPAPIAVAAEEHEEEAQTEDDHDDHHDGKVEVEPGKQSRGRVVKFKPKISAGPGRKPKKAPAKTGRKIRITAIHSNRD